MSGLGEKKNRLWGKGKRMLGEQGEIFCFAVFLFFLPFNILRDFLLLFSFGPSVLSSKLSVAVYSSLASYDPI